MTAVTAKSMTVTRDDTRVRVECACGSATVSLLPRWPSLVAAFVVGVVVGAVAVILA